MVLTPDEARELTEEDRGILADLTVEVEKKLQAEYVGDGTPVLVYPETTTRPKILKALLEQYKQAGWADNKVSLQPKLISDGFFLAFY